MLANRLLPCAGTQICKPPTVGFLRCAHPEPRSGGRGARRTLGPLCAQEGASTKQSAVSQTFIVGFRSEATPLSWLLSALRAPRSSPSAKAPRTKLRQRSGRVRPLGTPLFQHPRWLRFATQPCGGRSPPQQHILCGWAAERVGGAGSRCVWSAMAHVVAHSHSFGGPTVWGRHRPSQRLSVWGGHFVTSSYWARRSW